VEKHLHIVSYAIPYPPDYGGIIDVFYRIKSLHALGVKIHLHCFDYFGKKDKAFEDLCYKVYYYTRKSGISSQLSLLPYIVISRKNDELLKNLSGFDAPILFDGLHSTYYLNAPELKNRKKVVRAHNIEHSYYKILGGIEKNLIKKLFFYIESLKLRKYEKKLKSADKIACVSLKEHEYFTAKYGNSVFIPSSHHFLESESLEGKGDYVIFHGNLMVNENEEVALWIVRFIAPLIHFPIYIAGKNPSDNLRKACSFYNNVTLFENPDDAKMLELIKNAHVHLLPVFNGCGLRLKLLYALYAGRFCVVNKPMTEGTTLAALCEVANTPEEIASSIKKLFEISFTYEIKIERIANLAKDYNNIENAKKLIGVLY